MRSGSVSRLQAGRTRFPILAGALLGLALTGGIERRAATLNQEATKDYEDKNYEQAASKYAEALTHSPESGGISYNLGNALYRQQRFEDAASALARGAQNEDAALRQRSLYNLGNTFHRMGKLPEALEAYRRALDLDPADRDAKINYEKAWHELQQQQKQQQKNQNQGQQKDEDEKQEEKSQGSQGREQQEDKQQPQQGQEQQDEQQGAGEGEQAPPEDKEAQDMQAAADTSGVAEGELRPEEALRILEALRTQEEELQKERARKLRARARRVEKDW